MEPTHTCFLLTGTNLGDRQSNLQKAIEELNRLTGRVVARSAVYETEPWGVTGQDDYLNQALKLETVLSPHDLLCRLKIIERRVGRKPGTHMKPRILDIDILLYDDRIISSPKLRLPHPQLLRRNFAIIPLAEIAGHVLHPIRGCAIAKLVSQTGDDLAVRKLVMHP